MATSYLLYALPMGLVWMGITSSVSVPSFLIGYVLGVLILALARIRARRLNLARLPGQLLAGVFYVLILFQDILLSGIDVARRVLSPDMRLKLGVVAVSTQDTRKSKILAALSADVITLTPGELVVEIEDDHMMYVHCLDVEATAASADSQQARRLQLLNRVMGRST